MPATYGYGPGSYLTHPTGRFAACQRCVKPIPTTWKHCNQCAQWLTARDRMKTYRNPTYTQYYQIKHHILDKIRDHSMPRHYTQIKPEDAINIILPNPDIIGPHNEQGEPCPWPWDPPQLKGQPIGQYHCPYCGAMVLAGIDHPDYNENIPCQSH